MKDLPDQHLKSGLDLNKLKMFNCTLIIFVLLCTSVQSTLSQNKVPQDNQSFQSIADQIANYFSNQINKILFISKLASFFGTKATFQAANHVSLHNRSKREHLAPDTLSNFKNKLQHMLAYNSFIIKYLNNVTQTHRIAKQKCIINAIEEILFEFDSLSVTLDSHAIAKRHIVTSSLRTDQLQKSASALRAAQLQQFSSTLRADNLQNSVPENVNNTQNAQPQSPLLTFFKLHKWGGLIGHTIGHFLDLIAHNRTKRQILTTRVIQNVTQTLVKLSFLNSNIAQDMFNSFPKSHSIFNVTLTQGDDTSNITKTSLAYENALIILALASLIVLVIIQCTCKRSKKKSCPPIPRLPLHV